MRPGELQRLLQGEREAEPVNEAERKSDHPPALDVAPDDVLERHVEDGYCDQRFDQRREP